MSPDLSFCLFASHLKLREASSQHSSAGSASLLPSISTLLLSTSLPPLVLHRYTWKSIFQIFPFVCLRHFYQLYTEKVKALNPIRLLCLIFPFVFCVFTFCNYLNSFKSMTIVFSSANLFLSASFCSSRRPDPL